MPNWSGDDLCIKSYSYMVEGDIMKWNNAWITNIGLIIFFLTMILNELFNIITPAILKTGYIVGGGLVLLGTIMWAIGRR
jgi:hypothetical protein